MLHAIADFFHKSGFVTTLVLIWISFYLVMTLWVFLYKSIVLKIELKREMQSLSNILNGVQDAPEHSMFNKRRNHEVKKQSKELLQAWKHQVLKQSTTGLVVLSIISSTAPFIGLFGTVVEILEAFNSLGALGQASFGVIAPIISKALIATAGGILAAIPAYSFYLILKRKVYDLSVCVQMQVDILSSKEEESLRKF
ncbi:MotA/TolQ/ExbB proton channel family protein [Helicobacter pylori]|uniref:MotA/TolQ/ExbB proton channel family protein n=1 Tax=Helicobacter pylori TaxID=210 RepID=UPI00165CD566|nr:MotA/TolQ/ExbB proton channel family protein [Helicobacter pylori]WQS05389.1 MotA/TolQ/ExbB proton channel family protein [Helicobacter pylori]WQS08519.1 MotA/TolQ/ExbB proton channel family protein [Helicobacter pylori]WQS13485.1 MotA/TolQ/ExbB proton channel family protein [Helicobacter pylori]WQS20408.1 MotA/TolQ/ExbB proton channel family protein [Helicobacter pylori]WQS29744.1 MotA/TolQ/ExbB proton channel family protein [Helicobacter pylori]